jgi:hypothetical protein
MFWVIDPQYAYMFENGGKRRTKHKKPLEIHTRDSHTFDRDMMISSGSSSKGATPSPTNWLQEDEYPSIPDSNRLFQSMPSHFFEFKNLDQKPSEAIRALPSLSTMINPVIYEDKNEKGRPESSPKEPLSGSSGPKNPQESPEFQRIVVTLPRYSPCH